MPKIIDIEKYQPLSDDQFLFGTNIWFFIFYPIGNYQKKLQNTYSKFLNSCLRSGSKIYTTSIVISEFFNASVRTEYNKWRKFPENIGHDNFKENFRKSPLYQETVNSLVPVIKKQILGSSIRIPDNFHQVNIDKLLNGIEKSDFNDNYFITISEMNGFKVVSDDRDLLNLQSSVTILTSIE